MSSSVNALVLEQGSASLNPDGLTVTVDELHKVALDNVQYVYSAGETISVDEAEKYGLLEKAKKGRKSKGEGENGEEA